MDLDEPDDAPMALRAPAATWLVAGVLGIAADRWQGPPLSVWWCLLICGIVVGVWSAATGSRSTWALLLGWGAMFGAWHHVWWADPPANHIFHWATAEGRLLTVRARVVEPSWIREREQREPQLLLIVDAVSLLLEDGTSISAPGRLRVECSDPALSQVSRHWDAGELLDITGRLLQPATASNPDGFDYRLWLRTQRIEAVLRVKQTSLLVSRGQQATVIDELTNWRYRLRSRAIQRLQTTTDTTTAAVAEALLLGTRSQMPADVRQAFVHSGMLHLLAISGVNVGVIWIGLLRLFRILGLRYQTSSLCVMASLLAYAWLTAANPPIVRAVTFAVVFQLAALAGRRISALQGLSLAALVVLARNPTDLFNVGAWLSFLSVSVLAAAHRWCHAPVRRWHALWPETDEQSPDLNRSFQGIAALGEGVLRTTAATCAVWLASVPLVAAKFHLVSWAGVLLNLVVAPVFCVLLVLGYGWLLLVFVAPGLSDLLLIPTTWLLQGLLWLTKTGRGWSLGSAYVAGLPDWWLLGFYAGVVCTLLAPRWWTPRRKWGSLAVWVNVALLWSLVPQKPAGVVCDVVAVGHGLAIVLQGPAGKTLVYDAGSLAGGELAAEAVAQNLWQSGQQTLDVLIVSHADADHCNGVPELIERVRPGLLLAHPTFRAHDKPTVVAVREAWQHRGGHSAAIAAGDRIAWDPAVDVSVWLPDAATQYSRDNANSLVILVEYAGRSLLLTGDLEREGLSDLLQRPRTPVDILVAPHHGSPAANPRALGDWTHPGWVAISSADPSLNARLRDHFPDDCVLLNTATTGRIRFVISPAGDLQVQAFRQTP